MIVLFGVKGAGKDTAAAALTQYDYRPTSFAEPLKAMVAMAFPDFAPADIYGDSSRRETGYPQYEFGRVCLNCAGEDFDLCWGDGEYTKTGVHWQVLDGGRDGERYTHFKCMKCGAIYPKHITPRIALQTLGTQWGRRLHPSIWASAGIKRANSLRGVITDGRFRNELETCRRAGAHAVLLLRKLDESTETHQSEAELREMAKTEIRSTGPGRVFDYVIDNRGPLEELPRLLTTLHDWHCRQHGTHMGAW